MASDLGSLPIQITGCDSRGNPIGRRRDGSSITIASGDAEGRVGRLMNNTSTLMLKMYHVGALGISETADKRIAAAERFNRDFYEAGLSPKVCGNLERREGGEQEATPKQEGHYKAWRMALDAIGRHKNDVVMAVNWGEQPSCMRSMLLGLDKLVRHYD